MKTKKPPSKRRARAGESNPAGAPDSSTARALRPSILREMQALSTRPEIISFALGMPASELFPTAALASVVARVLAHDRDALQYSLPFEPLRNHVVKLMAARGVSCTESQVFLTTGAQQAIDLLVRLFVSPGGEALVEEATYDGLLTALRPLAWRPITVPTDRETGMDVDRVDAVLRAGARPAFLYAIPDGHNPHGVSLSGEKRARLVEIASRHGVPVIEDDAYGFLGLDGPAPPPLRAMGADGVVTIGSFSKVLAPALRVGWIVAPETIIGKLSILKHSSDLDVSTLAQRVVSAWLDTGAFAGHVATLRNEYRARRDAMHRALLAHFPPEARFRVPTCGLFFWVELPRGLDATTILRASLERERVTFVPGRGLAAADGETVASGMRLSFSACPPDRIADGIARLGRLVKDSLR